MKLFFALDILKKEYSKNKDFNLELVSDKLQFLMALTAVETSLNNNTLSESDYRKAVIEEESK